MTVHETLPCRVITGPGARREIPAELDRLGAARVMLVATGSAAPAADALAADLGRRLVARFDRPVVHTPVEVTAAALRRTADAEVVVAIGGGAAIGLAKALAARTGMAQVAVPTTYAGSEVTPVLGETDGGMKTTRRDPALAPGTVVYDPELTLSMPPGLTRTSALNALAHAVEALWAPDATAATDAFATESATLILATLPTLLALLAPPRSGPLGASLPGSFSPPSPGAPPAGPLSPGVVGPLLPDVLELRTRLQQAAWLAGLCLAQTRMGLHHQLAHALGGTFGLPHAELHALLLAHVAAFNLPHAPAAAARLTRIAGPDPAATIATLASAHDGPTTLRAMGVPRDGLAEVADRVIAAPYPNPRRLDRDDVLTLLETAW